MSDLDKLQKIVDKMNKALTPMTHEFWFSERTPYVGTVDYYKVLGAKSYHDLTEYWDSLHDELKKRLTPLEMNGEFALKAKLEEYSG